MLTIRHPEILPAIRDVPMGLLPVRDMTTDTLMLVIKAPKEFILTAKVNQGFKFYVAPLATNMGTVPALITAFFDDHDEPLVLKTPIFDDELATDLRELLNYETLDVYFFDEHSREWMSFRAGLKDGGSCLTDGTKLNLYSYTENRLLAVFEGINHWFGNRTAEDDAKAIVVSFLEPLAPDDLFILDATVPGNDYLGSKGFHHTQLVREDPGPYQERDIAMALRRTFTGAQIAINPFRADTGKELTDALAVAAHHFLIVQAKDSPNTPESLGRTISRKRQTGAGQLAKAVRQAIGAAAYVRSHDPLELVIEGERVDVAVEDRAPFCAVVIKEMFDDEGNAYVAAVQEMDAAGVRGLVLDYPTLHAFTHALKEEAQLMTALEDARACVLATKSYPDLRTFLVEFTAWMREEPPPVSG